MKTTGVLPPTGLVFSLARLYLCLSLSCLHHELTLAQINGWIKVDPNRDVTSLDDPMRSRNLTCEHDIVAVVTGGTFAITVKSIEWLFDGQLTATRGPVFHVAASSLRQSGNYTCRVTYTYRDLRWEYQNVTEITQEVVVVATFNEQLRLLTPTFVNTALRPPSNKMSGSSKNTVLVGSRFSFDCDATSRLTAPIRYRLYRSDNPGKSVSSIKDYSQIMTFSDAVVWWCDVSNFAGHMYHFFNINVTAPISGTWYIPTTKLPPESTPRSTTTPESTNSSDVHSASKLPVEATSPSKQTKNSSFVVILVYSFCGIFVAIVAITCVLDKERWFKKRSIPVATAAGARSHHRSRLEPIVSVRSTNPMLSIQILQTPSKPGELPATPIFGDDDTFQYVSEADVEKALARSTPDFVGSQQEPEDGNVAKQTELSGRITAVESRTDQLGGLVRSMEIQNAKRLENLEHKCLSADAPVPVSQTSEMWEAMRRVTRTEMQAEARKNNAVLADLPEEDGSEDVVGVVKGLLPDIAGEILSAKRLGKPRGSGQSTVQQDASESIPDSASSASRPRPVLLELTARGKSLLWQRRRDLKYNNQPVYVSHHMTHAEQVARRTAMPIYKQFRAKQIRCSLPRGQILDSDGQVFTEDGIASLLSSS